MKLDPDVVVTAIDLIELWGAYVDKWEADYDLAQSAGLPTSPPDIVGFMQYLQEELEHAEQLTSDELTA